MKLKEIINEVISKWMAGTGPEEDVVVSSRVRLARNLSGYPFPPLASPEQAQNVLNAILYALRAKPLQEMAPIEMAELRELNPAERELLVEKHLVSPQFILKPENKAVILSEDEAISIMVNEEDHLRIQCIYPGFNLDEAWKLANQADDLLEQSLDLAYCEKKGFLTSCPTNVGTGLRASVMLHLPALVMTSQISRFLNALPQLGLAVRGLYGEGTQAAGNLFQISNQVTLGADEQEIIRSLESVVKQIIQHERAAREQLYQQVKPQMEDFSGRALGILKYAYIISSQETMKLLSDLRLGISLNIIKEVNQGLINELMVSTQPAYLQQRVGKKLDNHEMDIKRADLIREKLRLTGC